MSTPLAQTGRVKQMYRSHMYRVAVVNPINDSVLYVAEVVEQKQERSSKRHENELDRVEIVEKDLGRTKASPTGKNYEHAQYTQKIPRESNRSRDTSPDVCQVAEKQRGNGSPFS